MLAYMFFTPCFRDGRVIGYQANILRRDPKIAKCVFLSCLYISSCVYDVYMYL
jgi:hypothetical protein